MIKTIVSGPTTYGRKPSLILLFLALFSTAGPCAHPAAEAAQAILSWTPPTTNSDGTPLTDLAGFMVYAGNAPGSYQVAVDAGNQTDYTLENLSDGSTYYFAVTAYDTSRKESGYSNETSKSFPALPAVYIVTATTGSGGTLTPLDNTKVNQASNGAAAVSSVSVDQGASQSFNVAAATGYRVVDVVVDGVSAGPVASYTFNNVAANHTISASFAVNSLSVTPVSGANGSMAPSTIQAVDPGASAIFTISPSSGYRIAAVTGCGGTLSGGTYTTGAVTGACSVSASFTAVTASQTRDGILNPGAGKTRPEVADALRSLMIAIGNIIPTPADLAHGDVAPRDAGGNPQGDGKMDIADAILILRMTVGLQ